MGIHVIYQRKHSHSLLCAWSVPKAWRVARASWKLMYWPFAMRVGSTNELRGKNGVQSCSTCIFVPILWIMWGVGAPDGERDNILVAQALPCSEVSEVQCLGGSTVGHGLIVLVACKARGGNLCHVRCAGLPTFMRIRLCEGLQWDSRAR